MTRQLSLLTVAAATLSLSVVLAVAAPPRGHGKRPNRNCTGAVTSSSMVYELAGLDLDSGVTIAADSPFDMDPSVDVIFAYNADTPTHLRVFPQYPTKTAVLEDTPFEDVSCEDASNAGTSLEPEDIDVPVDAADTVVVETAEGRVFKIGNATEYSDLGVDFEFAELCTSCPK